MTFPSARRAKAFFLPLKRKATVFLVQERETDIRVGQILVRFAASLNWKTLILDTDALYASSLEGPAVVGSHQRGKVLLRIPTADNALEDWIIESILDDYQLIILDDLNTFHNLLSAREDSANKVLQFLGKALSYLCRSNNTVAALIVHQSPRGPPEGQRSRFSLSNVGDLLVFAHLQDSAMHFTSDSKIWTTDRFSVRA